MKKRVVSTKGMGTAEWLAWRRGSIGGSDCSIIMGHNKFKSIQELFDEKTGSIPINDQENDYTHFGHVLEPVIRDEFYLRSGKKVRQVHAILKSKNYDWMTANVDGIVTEFDGSKSIFEAKTASEYRKDEILKAPPQEYVDQVTHYMYCLGLRKAYICFLIGGHTYVCHEVLYDEVYAAEIVEKEKQFWNMVENNIRPEVDGMTTTTEYLACKYADTIGNEIELPDSANEYISAYEEAEKQIKLLREIKDKASNSLKLLLGENEVGKLGSGRVVFWKQCTRNDLDRSSLKQFLGDSIQDFLKPTVYRKFDIA